MTSKSYPQGRGCIVERFHVMSCVIADALLVFFLFILFSLASLSFPNLSLERTEGRTEGRKTERKQQVRIACFLKEKNGRTTGGS